MVPLADGLVERLGRRDAAVAARKYSLASFLAFLKSRAGGRFFSEKLLSKFQQAFFHTLLVNVGDYGECHTARLELLLYEIQKLFPSYLLY